jgi:hypothetical protein
MVLDSGPEYRWSARSDRHITARVPVVTVRLPALAGTWRARRSHQIVSRQAIIDYLESRPDAQLTRQPIRDLPAWRRLERDVQAAVVRLGGR